MKKLWMSGAAAVMAVGVAGLNAQMTGSQTPQTQTPQTQTMPHAEHGKQATTTLRGCVYQEKDVPGRTPNVAERAGVMEDYILVPSMDHSSMHGTTGAMTGAMPPATTPPTTTPPPTTPPTTMPPATSGTTGAGTMSGTSGGMMHAMHVAYKLEKVPEGQLKTLVGKMVEVTGKVDAARSDTAPAGAAGTSGTATAPKAPALDKGLGPDDINLPEFEVTTIKAVEGTCPATPTLNKK